MTRPKEEGKKSLKSHSGFGTSNFSIEDTMISGQCQIHFVDYHRSLNSWDKGITKITKLLFEAPSWLKR